MAKKPVRKKRIVKQDTGMAFVATFFGLIGFFIALVTRRKDSYVMFYAKQSLVWTITAVIFSVVKVVPVMGPVISVLGGILVFVLWIIMWVYALSGEKKETPIIGEFADKIKL